MNKLFLAVLFFFALACKNNKQKISGPYLDQELPGDEPQLFAPGIVNDGISTRDITFSPDGKEIYFGKNIGNSSFATIFYCRQTENGWTKPEVLPFATNPEFIYIEPFVSPDGMKLFFVSNKGNEFTPENRFVTDIWIAKREGDFWGEPQKMDTIINSEDSEFFPSVAENGNLCFTRENPDTRAGFIYKSEYRDGKYQPPVKLPPQVNAGRARFNATISRDEQFIIVPVYGRDDSFGSTDYYISFQNAEKGWSEPLNLGNKINTPGGNEYSAGFSPDGNYFFFMSARINTPGKPEFTWEKFRQLHNSPGNGNSSIYWMKTDFIKKLQENAIFTEN